MGKTTNLLEKIAKSFWNKSNNLLSELEQFFVFHNVIIKDLKISNELFIAEIEDVYRALEKRVNQSPSNNFHFEYDQIVSYGELLSTKIVAAYLKEQGLNAMWLDARKVIKTDNSYQEGRVKWEKTKKAYEQEVKPLLGSQTFFISQGFIGQTDEGMTTTLGREGSDFTASIYAYVSNAENVTIWKDVPGMLNADPKYFSGTVLLKKISFTEAVELAYYGASVIHPKTIQPLKNNDIPLYIKSFLNPDNEGTVIQSSTEYDAEVPSYIFKENQVLISVTPKDFSFVVEDQLTAIFSLLTKQHVRINLMQNSAVSFSFLIDNKYKLSQLVKNLSKEFNEDLKKWNAEIDKTSLSVRFKAPEILFNMGSANIKKDFEVILNDFFPRFINILYSKKYKNDIEEIRIEGHTSSFWRTNTPEETAYIYNMELSQDRTRNVLRYVLSIEKNKDLTDWIRQNVTANGLSSSKLILDKDGNQNRELSRRVEFRVKTNAEKRIAKILNQ